MGSIAALALGTLGVAVYRAWQKSNTARAKRVRQVGQGTRGVSGAWGAQRPMNQD